MYTTVNRDGYSPLYTLVQGYREARFRVFNGGKAQRDRMAHDARVDGETNGIALGLQTLVVLQRIQSFPKLDQVTIPTVQECDEYLDRAVHLLIEASGDNDELNQAWEQIREEFSELIADPMLVQWEDERREAAILAGTEQPSDEDLVWLREKAAAAQAEAERLQRALSGTQVNASN